MTEEEIDNLKKGDVIRYGSRGKLRIVRGVQKRLRKKDKKDPKYGQICVVNIEVIIMKCSWTTRPNTFVDRWYLKKYCELVPDVSVDLESSDFQKFFETSGYADTEGLQYHCCDVKGIP